MIVGMLMRVRKKRLFVEKDDISLEGAIEIEGRIDGTSEGSGRFVGRVTVVSQIRPRM